VPPGSGGGRAEKKKKMKKRDHFSTFSMSPVLSCHQIQIHITKAENIRPRYLMNIDRFKNPQQNTSSPNPANIK
jgi:hypothetical protein